MARPLCLQDKHIYMYENNKIKIIFSLLLRGLFQRHVARKNAQYPVVILF